MLTRTSFIILLQLCVIVSSSELWGTEQTIVATGSMITGREGHSAIELAGGKVLIVGGRLHDGPSIVQAEIYDPTTGTFSPAGNLNIGRYDHQVTALPGIPTRVLVTGGRSETFTTGMSSAEIYDPDTNTFTMLSASMTTSRYNHTVSYIIEAAGRQLISGGYSSDGTTLATAELFNPETETFTQTSGNMTVSRAAHQAQTVLNGKKVLIMGGISFDGISSNMLSSTEVFDSENGVFSPTGNMASPRMSFASAWYNAGDFSQSYLLVTGGSDGTRSLASSEILIEDALSFRNAAGAMSSARAGHTVSFLPNGFLLVAGGVDDIGRVSDQIEIFDPFAETFTPVFTMSSPRTSHVEAIFDNGLVLLAGGFDGVSETSTADLVNVTDPPPLTPEKKGKPCLWLLATRGSHLETNLDAIRRFRDRYLLTNAVGRALVKIYYHYSPPAAEFISRHELARTLTRWAITPVLWCVEYPFAFLAALAALIVSGVIRVMRSKAADQAAAVFD